VTGTPSADDFAPTSLYAHNLLLRKGPDFRIYIRWIRGQMVRTRRQVNPSSDDRESFVLQIQKGVIHANIGDISNYLYASSLANAPLKNISLQPEGDQLKLHGTVYKIVSFPIELVGTSLPLRMAGCSFNSRQVTPASISGNISFTNFEHKALP
jgi:hypothetical protein